MNNTGDITNSAIFLNFGGRGFARRFGDAQDSYYTKVEEAINKTAKNRDIEKQAFVQKFVSDNNTNLQEEKKRIEEDKKKEQEFLKPLISARKQTYDKTKAMRYQLTLLENKYHDYIVKNIDDLPKKIAALKKAFEYVRNTKLASKELSLKQKEFYKKQMDSYLKQWTKLNRDGSVKLQTLRTLYRLNLDLSLKKENEDKINEKIVERFKTLEKLLKDLNDKLVEAQLNNNREDAKKYRNSIKKIEDDISMFRNKEKDVAGYIQKVDTLYDKFLKFTSTNINRLIDYPFSFDA